MAPLCCSVRYTEDAEHVITTNTVEGYYSLFKCRMKRHKRALACDSPHPLFDTGESTGWCQLGTSSPRAKRWGARLTVRACMDAHESATLRRDSAVGLFVRCCGH